MRVQVVQCFVHIFIAVWFPKDNCRSSSSIQVLSGGPGSYEVKLGNCGDIGTGTKSGGTCTRMQLRSSGVLVPLPNQGAIGT